MEFTRFVSVAAWVLGLAACAQVQHANNVPLPTAELATLATGNTMTIVQAPGAGVLDDAGPCSASSHNCTPRRVATIYFSPDGGGWIDEQARRGIAPWTGTMAMVLGWRVGAPSTICLTASPLIGDMPSFSPPRHECITVGRTPEARPRLAAAVTQAGATWTGSVTVTPGNAFPPALTAQYIDMVKVLYGQQIPRWTEK